MDQYRTLCSDWGILKYTPMNAHLENDLFSRQSPFSGMFTNQFLAIKCHHLEMEMRFLTNYYEGMKALIHNQLE
jgi:hypothetical protein